MSQSLSLTIVPLTGLEPVVSALRGRRVNHLHHSGKLFAIDGYARAVSQLFFVATSWQRRLS